MKFSTFFTKKHFCIVLIILIMLAQLFMPYKTSANNSTDSVISIHLIGDHNSDKYWFGQCLIPLKINAYMESGNDVGSIPVEKSWISGYNSEKLGKQTVTIAYGGKTTTFTVTVLDYLKSINVVGLKQNYKVGETLDLSNASITEITASGIKIPGKPITQNMITGFDTTKPGVKKLTINYHKNELGENIKLETFINVSDSLEVSLPQNVTPATPTTSSPSEVNPQISTKAPIINIQKDNAIENSISINEDTKTELNNIFENVLSSFEANFKEKATGSIKSFVLVIVKLSTLFI